MASVYCNSLTNITKKGGYNCVSAATVYVDYIQNGKILEITAVARDSGAMEEDISLTHTHTFPLIP